MHLKSAIILRNLRPGFKNNINPYSRTTLRLKDDNLQYFVNEMQRLILLYDRQVPAGESLSKSMILHYFLNGLPRYQEELTRHTTKPIPLFGARTPHVTPNYMPFIRELMELDMYGRGRRRSSSRSFNRIRSSA